MTDVQIHLVFGDGSASLEETFCYHESLPAHFNSLIKDSTPRPYSWQLTVLEQRSEICSNDRKIM